MALQLIVQTANNKELFASLGNFVESIELLPMADGLWGISVPTKSVDILGEDRIRNSLSKFNVYDLYTGEWHYS
jgi:hypothetical protein